MKLLVTFSILFLGCGCFAKLYQEQAKILANLAKTCYTDLDIPEDSDILLRSVKNELTFTEQESNFILCAQQKFGMLDSEGNYNIKKMKDFFMKSETLDQQAIIDQIDLCFHQRQETTLVEKAREGYKCFMLNNKLVFV